MKARTTKLSVTPNNCSLFELGATHIHIRDEAAGEFVTITQSTDERHGDHIISINPEEWPAIRSAINKLIKQCR
ncbi:MAG: hypothetical protein M0Q29_10025 [Thiopseudomonas sp.]|nr:hypothetical protein [Thiopseudomonas sp.]